MLTVKTSLRHSALHGMGVFAEQFIPAGTIVWQFRLDFDFRVSEESVAELPDIARERLLHYSAKWGGGYVISADDARFLNHSETPNLRTCDEPDCDIAIRDIQIGEELLEDYREFDDTFAGRPISRGIKQAATAQEAEPRYWLLHFDEDGKSPEIFTDEAAARQRQKHCLVNWSCTLFAQQSGKAGGWTMTRRSEIQREVNRLIALRVSRSDLTPRQWAAIGQLIGVKEIRAAIVQGMNGGVAGHGK